MRTFIRIALFIFGAGLICAILTLFGFNPFAVLIRGLEWVYWAIQSVSNELLKIGGFRTFVTSKPGSPA